MIVKEVNYDLGIEEWKNLLNQPGLTADQQKMARFHLAGVQAEKDAAYYLNTTFAGRDDFRVFHNLRVQHGDRTAQIDHLVLTRWTAYFVESKSVSQVISINEYGEWGRIYNRRFMPMESPIEQSRRHRDVLYDFMTDHRDQFMGSLLGLMHKHFSALLTAKHYVAISVKGQIQGRGRRRMPEVMKADQVPTAILEYHKSLNRGFFSSPKNEEEMVAFNKREFEAVTQFLLKHDVALTPMQVAHQVIDQIEQQARQFAAQEREASEAELAQEAPAADVPADYRCRKCDSRNLAVLDGQYGPYFKCGDCRGNTPIVEMCEQCGQKMDVAQRGSQFALVCKKCDGSRPLVIVAAGASPKAAPSAAPAPAPAPARPAVASPKPASQTVAPPPVAAPAPAGVTKADAAPACPKCGGVMKLRTAKRGDNAGGQFWGCTHFPKCRGIVQA